MEEKRKIKRPRGVAQLIPGKCIACGARCQSDCRTDAIEMNDEGEPIILAEKCTAIINVPVLKDHDLAGVTMAMKNFYGAIHNPNKYHDNNCNPYIAELNTSPIIKDKTRLIVCDALLAQYNGGPAFKPQYTWNYGGFSSAAIRWPWTGSAGILSKKSGRKKNSPL